MFANRKRRNSNVSLETSLPLIIIIKVTIMVRPAIGVCGHSGSSFAARWVLGCNGVENARWRPISEYQKIEKGVEHRRGICEILTMNRKHDYIP